MESDSEYVGSDEEGQSSSSETRPGPSPAPLSPPPSSPPLHRARSFSSPGGDLHHEPEDVQLQRSSRASANDIASTSSLIVPTLHTNDFAQGEDAKTYFTRPNRYFGPASTWKSWTEQERNVALSLDRVRAGDLALHLTNSFVLKRRFGLAAGKSKDKGKGKGKGKQRARTRSVDSNEDLEAGLDVEADYYLPKTWTAWPLPANQVPREELLPRVGSDPVYRAEADGMPSAALEECLVAMATRLARRRWEAREWEEHDEVVGKQDIDRHAAPLDNDDEGLTGSDLADEEELQEDDLTSDQAISSDSEPDPDYPAFSSQAANLNHEDFESDFNQRAVKHEPLQSFTKAEDAGTRRPVPLADDEEARRIFLPNARHILTQLDQLLLGLHKQRHAYASKPTAKPRGRSQSTGISSRSASAMSRSRSRGRKVSRSSRPEDVPDDLVESDISMASAHDAGATATTPPTAESLQHQRRVKGLGLRDWSDVMGIASLTGWNPDVVQRASERCAALFGENMLFRTFHEGDALEKARDKESGTQKSYFTEHLALESEGSDEEGSGHETDGDGDEGQEIILSVESQSRTCPYQTCPRHIVPFRKRDHVQRHLDSVHRGQARGRASRLDSRSKSKSRPVSTARTRSENSATAAAGPSHGFSFDLDVLNSSSQQDPIVCPVRDCPRHLKPFSKGTKLYAHVRRMHPDVDVGQIKMMEVMRRGERRGRPRGAGAAKRSRSRSTSHAERSVSTPRRRRRVGDSSGLVEIDVGSGGDE